MKRKLVRQGNDALTVTLPRGWLRQYSLDAGKEVNVDEKGRDLVISARPSSDAKTAEVDLDKINGIIPKYIRNLYKEGVTEIHLRYSSVSLMQDVQKTIDEEIIGYEIVEQNENAAVVRAVADVVDASFESIFRRVFRVNESMLEGMNDILRGKKFSEANAYIRMEKTNNKLVNYCRRVITRNLYGGENMLQTYMALERLERMSDEIKFALEYLQETRGLAITQNEIKLAEDALSFFRLCGKAYFSKDFSSYAREATSRKDLIKDTMRLFSKATRKDFCIMHHLINVIQYTVQILTYRLHISIDEARAH